MVYIDKRIKREKKTVYVMIRMYCQHFHREKEMCNNCLDLYKYTEARIDKCPFGQTKPVCNVCTVHCFKKDIREEVKKIMRFSGPKMILYHPYLAVKHLIDKKRSKT